MRVVGTISAAFVVLATGVANPLPAQAAVQIDLTINFIPSDPIIPGNPVIPQQLTGVPFFTIPEPSTWAMMILGFAGIGFMAYRQAIFSTTQLKVESSEQLIDGHFGETVSSALFLRFVEVAHAY